MRLAKTGTLQGMVKAPKAPVGTNLLGVEVYVPGSPYLAKTDAAGAYFLPNMPEGTFDLVAAKSGLGNAQVEGAVVKADSRTSAPDLVLAVAEPTISALEPSNGASGSVITIRGKHFGFETQEIVKVTFSGAPAARVERPDAGTLVATVPAGAQSGNVAVDVAGIASNQVPFQVVQDFAIEPAAPELAVGKDRLLTVKARDTANRPVASPAVLWSLLSGTNLSVTPGGLVTGKGTGVSKVACRIGAIERQVDVTVFRISAVATSPAQLSLFIPPASGAAGINFPASGTLKATVTASDRADRGVTWTSDDETIKVDQAGVVTLLSGAKPGTASISAASADDPAVTARAIVAVGSAKPLHLPAIRSKTTFASEIGFYGGAGTGVAVDAAGNLYVAHNVGSGSPFHDKPQGAKVSKITPGGQRSDFVPIGTLVGATDVAVDAAGNLFVAEGIGYLAPYWGNPQGNRVLKVTPSGQISTFITKVDNPTGLTFDRAGNLYVASWNDNAIYKYSPSGEPLGKFAGGFDAQPYDIATDANDNIYVAAAMGYTNDKLYSGKKIYKVTPAGASSVFYEAPGGEPVGLAFDAEGHLWATYYNAQKLARIAPDGSAVTFPIEAD
ncbi:MAG: IPT/TIG domain-containing protein, partial [Candidatus Sericytochromatia bacterium]|nr:IPT/TIG domain-containing protein [Candidatus Tanganyikabacteria bacterium]